MRLILILVVLAAVLLPTATHAAAIDLTGAVIGYARSFDGAHEGAILKLPMEIAEWQAGKVNIGLAVEPLLIDSQDVTTLGVGASVTIKNAIRGLSVGVGYLPRDFGWSWNIGLVVLEF
jgi:hypothetical protein